MWDKWAVILARHSKFKPISSPWSILTLYPEWEVDRAPRNSSTGACGAILRLRVQLRSRTQGPGKQIIPADW